MARAGLLQFQTLGLRRQLSGPAEGLSCLGVVWAGGCLANSQLQPYCQASQLIEQRLAARAGVFGPNDCKDADWTPRAARFESACAAPTTLLECFACCAAESYAILLK